MAQRIGNLIGHLHFSDDDLRKTQKGLKESGVSMPNFGNVGSELAKEINEEPEPEVETEEERKPLSQHNVFPDLISCRSISATAGE
jgi:Ras GTPase-activating-like protein IQGAP2/3